MFVVPRLMRSAHTRQMLFHGTLIVGFGRALDDFQGSGRAAAKTGAQAVAEVIGKNLGLAVDNLDRAFGAVQNALAAAVAEVFIDFDDVACGFHGCFRPLVDAAALRARLQHRRGGPGEIISPGQ